MLIHTALRSSSRAAPDEIIGETKRDFGMSCGEGELQLLLEETVRPFSDPPGWESQDAKVLRKLLELPLPSYILSQPIPRGWEIRQYEHVKESESYGYYFLHPKTGQPTGILWHDPERAIGEDIKPTGDQVKRLQPIRYHFPEAFHLGEKGDNAIETSSLVTDQKRLLKRIALE